MRIVIVGEAPNSGSLRDRPDLVLGGAIGKRLAYWAGVTIDEYLEWTTRVNLFDEATRWSKPKARLRAAQILDELQPEDVLILLGEKVAEAFGASDYKLYEWRFTRTQRGYASVVRLPHPSGRNRVLNDPVARARVGLVFREAMEVAGR